MGLIDFKNTLKNYKKVALDTAPIIYFVEGQPNFYEISEQLFQLIADKIIEGETSCISLTEVLIHPLNQENKDLESTYIDFLQNSEGIICHPINGEIAILAAKLRAKYSNKTIRTPDALQIATAIVSGCTAIVTNDEKWRKIEEISCLILKDFIENNE